VRDVAESIQAFRLRQALTARPLSATFHFPGDLR
jgi:hypothetical protein